MSPSEKTNAATRKEWRELGSYYKTDDEQKQWRFVGSRNGLLRLPSLLDQYVSDPRNVAKSEHEHYGPYMYLKIMTWSEPDIVKGSIHGKLEDLSRLAVLLRSKLQGQEPGSEVVVGSEYSPDVKYSLLFEIMQDDFDPASVDPELK